MRNNKRLTLAERCSCPNNTLFIIALFSLIFFLFIEVVIRTYALYSSAPLVDIPSHFFAGIALAAGIYWITSLTSIQRKKSVTLFLTFVGAGIWEVLETLEELVIVNPPLLRDVFFWDGFWDIIITVIGGAFALALFYILKRKTNLLKGIAGNK